MFSFNSVPSIGRLHLEHGSDLYETSPKHVSDDSRHLICRYQNKKNSGCLVFKLPILSHCVLPRHNCVLPKHTCVLPKHNCFLPRHTCALPRHNCVLPRHSCVLPRSNCVFRGTAIFCRKSYWNPSETGRRQKGAGRN